MHTAAEIESKTVIEVRNVAVNYVGKLDVGELLTGTPTVAEIDTTDLTFANIGVSTVALTIAGVSVPLGRAAQFKVSGGVAGTKYRIRVTATSDAVPAQILIVILILNVTGD